MSNTYKKSYSDAGYSAQHQTQIADSLSMTSVQASASTLARITVMQDCEVVDWNVGVIEGTTCTGTPIFQVTINKSLGGTGTVAAMGTASIGTAADKSVVDAAVAGGTGCQLVAGDDIVINTVAGTALPADNITLRFHYSWIEKFN